MIGIPGADPERSLVTERRDRPVGWRSRPASGDDDRMGPVLIVIVVVVAIPVGVLMSGAVAAGLLGFLVKDEVDRNHAGSELLETNV